MMKSRRDEASPKNTGPKIIVQYRAKRAKVYELKADGGVVAVRICQDVDDAVPNGWHVDAQSDSGLGPSGVEAWGTTAAEALESVAKAWKAHSPALNPFDWDAIAR